MKVKTLVMLYVSAFYLKVESESNEYVSSFMWSFIISKFVTFIFLNCTKCLEV